MNINVRISADEKKALLAECEKTGKTISEIIREALVCRNEQKREIAENAEIAKQLENLEARLAERIQSIRAGQIQQAERVAEIAAATRDMGQRLADGINRLPAATVAAVSAASAARRQS